jgi:serine phosphatase RsbU (regulator of sigma subunit)
MLGISNLNEIVRRKEITKTGEVLDQLRKAVIEALKQKGVTGEQKDGMDIVFCAYNNQTRILQYSGANNSLYILKKDSAGYELNEYKADPQPVAIHVSMTNFTTHEIPVEKGDMLYLISDGYADQFGGPKNKKFMIRNLKSLLCDISSKPLNEQKEILETTIREWMGNNEQIDDITLMGIKI